VDLECVKVDGMEVHLLGTAHVSSESARQVGQAIEDLRPDVVAVELCDKRFEALVEGKKWDDLEVTKVLESGRMYLFLAQILLSNFQRRVGDELGVKPGQEMLSAVEEAKKRGIRVELVDRDIQVTLKRAFDQLGFLEKLKLGFGFFENWMGGEKLDEKAIEKLKENDVLTELLEELGREIPSVKRTLVDERDEYIAKKIAAIDGVRVLAVLGAGHIGGVKKHLNGLSGSVQLNYNLSVGGVVGVDENIEVKRAEKGAGAARKIKIVGYLVPAVFAAIIAYSLITHGGGLTLNLLVKWFLINGTLSALGAAIVFAHPITVLTAFLAAPFTSLNPMVAAGWVAAYVEVKLRKPRVRDFHGLMELDGLGDYASNRVTKVVLIAALANLGSTVGTFIALPYIASLL